MRSVVTTIGEAVYREAILATDYGWRCQYKLDTYLANLPRIDSGEWMINAQEEIDEIRTDEQEEIGHTLPSITIDIGANGYEMVVEYPFTPANYGTQGDDNETHDEPHHPSP